MTRVENWPQVLADEIEDAVGYHFAWGVRDCATWAFDVRRALTGEDAAAAWRGRYTTAFGAARMLRRLGVESVEGLACKVMGAPVRPALAQRGDLVLAAEDDALGVCLGSGAAFLAPVGLSFRPMTETRAAWRV